MNTQKTRYTPTTPSRTTKVSPWRNTVADELASSSTVITDVIPRDTGLSTERYIVFTTHDPETLPYRTQKLADELGLKARHLSEHAIDYQHSETYQYATYLLR
jgi:hypothetical protein